MAYPNKSSIIDMRSKIKRPVLKTKLILDELERMASNTSAEPQRRSLRANRSLVGSSSLAGRSSLNRSSFAYVPPRNLLQNRRQTIQPRWPRTFPLNTSRDADEMNEFTYTSGASDESTSFKSPEDHSELSAYRSNITAPIQQEQPSFVSNASFSFIVPKTNPSTINELENVSPFTFDEPLKSNFLLQDLQNTFEFDMPTMRGPREDALKESLEAALNESDDPLVVSIDD